VDLCAWHCKTPLCSACPGYDGSIAGLDPNKLKQLQAQALNLNHVSHDLQDTDSVLGDGSERLYSGAWQTLVEQISKESS